MIDYEMAYPCSNIAHEKPLNLDDMIVYAKQLSKKFLHARVDFYNIDGKIIFGEITFTNSAGFGNVSPKEFDLKMGGYLDLLKETK